jgi:methyl-accepting chemotaxis protein
MAGAKSHSQDTEESFENAAIILSEIAGGIDSISEVINHFSETAEDQIESVQGVLSTITIIKDASRNALKGTEESSETCQGVLSQSVKLKEMVAHFNLQT